VQIFTSYSINIIFANSRDDDKVIDISVCADNMDVELAMAVVTQTNGKIAYDYSLSAREGHVERRTSAGTG
jgi:hypothetical protein